VFSETTADLEKAVRLKAVPQHVAIIMDGNGRWAEAMNRPRLDGHREGSSSVRDVTRCCRRIGVRALTLYAFSSQNWNRPPEEVAGLMELLREYIIEEREEILSNGIRLEAVGELEKLPRYVSEPLDALRRDSQHHSDMVLTLALSYGGQEELVNAAKRLVHLALSGELKVDDIDRNAVQQALWTGALPDVDLIIRTSGEQRLSNFMPWQSAYAELVFTDTAWPDFRARRMLECIHAFQNRERRFGLTSSQLRRAGT
jgi:undecaprenyl diphosphate synthase